MVQRLLGILGLLCLIAITAKAEAGKDCDLSSFLPKEQILGRDTVEEFMGDSEKAQMTVLFLHTRNNTLCADYLKELQAFLDIMKKEQREGLHFGAIDCDKNPEIPAEMNIPQLPVLMYATGESKNLVEYNGLFIAEKIWSAITQTLDEKLGYLENVDQWEEVKKGHDCIVLALLRDQVKEDVDFFNSFTSLFEGNYSVNIVTGENLREHLVAQGLVNDTISETDYLCTWQKYATYGQGEGLQCSEYKRLGEGADFDTIFAEYTRYSSFLNRNAFPIFDYYSQIRYIQTLDRQVPLLMVMSTFLIEKQEGQNSLWNRIIRLVSKNPKYYGKVYALYVESDLFEKQFKKLPVKTPGLLIEDEIQLPHIYNGRANPTDQEILAFVDQFLEGKATPFFITEKPEIYAANNTDSEVTYLVGSNVADFLKQSVEKGPGHAFILTYHDPFNESAKAIDNFINIAGEVRSPYTFGMIDVENNLFPSKQLVAELRHNYHHDIAFHFKGGSFEDYEIYPGDVTGETFKDWVEQRLQGSEVRSEL